MKKNITKQRKKSLQRELRVIQYYWERTHHYMLQTVGVDSREEAWGDWGDDMQNDLPAYPVQVYLIQFSDSGPHFYVYDGDGRRLSLADYTRELYSLYTWYRYQSWWVDD
jgi:hypothetical protein